jgi:hypothetical protein
VPGFSALRAKKPGTIGKKTPQFPNLPTAAEGKNTDRVIRFNMAEVLHSYRVQKPNTRTSHAQL